MSDIHTVNRSLERAREQHAKYDQEVTRLQKSVGPTSFKLVQAKQAKLRAKDEVTKLEKQLSEMNNEKSEAGSEETKLPAVDVTEEQIEMPLEVAS